MTLLGGSGNDTLTSTGYGGWLVGGVGADTLISNSPSNTSNFASYEYAAGGVGVTYNGATGTGWAGEATGDTLSGRFGFNGSAHADQFNVSLPYMAELRAGAGDDVIYVNMNWYGTVYGNGVWHHSLTDSDNDTIINSGTGGTIYGGNGNDTISGGGTLYGDAGMDVITSGVGDQLIYLGADADVDTFVFSRLKGFDSVANFTSIDVIDIGAGYKYDDFGDILANSQQVGGNVDIWFESNMKITILNYNLSSLTAANFEFV